MVPVKAMATPGNYGSRKRRSWSQTWSATVGSRAMSPDMHHEARTDDQTAIRISPKTPSVAAIVGMVAVSVRVRMRVGVITVGDQAREFAVRGEWQFRSFDLAILIPPRDLNHAVSRATCPISIRGCGA